MWSTAWGNQVSVESRANDRRSRDVQMPCLEMNNRRKEMHVLTLPVIYSSHLGSSLRMDTFYDQSR